MKNLETDLDKIKNEILSGFQDPITEGAITDFLSGSSKRVRSRLALLYIKALGKVPSENIYKILSAGELIHNASLLHDDVLDEAEKRRGKSTIAKEYGFKISILAGDYLISTAVEKLLDVNNKKILEIFKDCTKKMSHAEIKQYFLRGEIPAGNEYLQICADKTASLFEAVLESCAVELNFNAEIAKRLGNIFGLYFQVKNDLEDFSAKEDIKNGIKTAADIFGIEKTESLLDNYKRELWEIIKDIPKNEYKDSLEELIKGL